MNNDGDDHNTWVNQPQGTDKERSRRQVKQKLQTSKKGNTLTTLDNAIIIMANDPDLISMVARDAFTARNLLLRPVPNDVVPQPGPYPRDLNDIDIAHLQAFLQRNYSPRFSWPAAKYAILGGAAARSFHPVTDWLDTLEWDGTERIDTWMIITFGAPDLPYVRDVGAKFLIAAVRRVRHPGCQFDHVPVLEGAQRIGKSRCCRNLFGADWFTDQLPASLKDKDASLSMLGVWGIELSEIEHILKNDVDVVKAFISRRTDRFRPPYGHGVVLQPRQCVLIGTTNRDDYLRDDTGNSRFWPIACQGADWQWIAENREQLWAEAAKREADGEPIWLDDQQIVRVATEAQAERLAEDPWHREVMDFVSGKIRTTATAVLEHLGIPKERWDQRASARVGAILRLEGWKRVSHRNGPRVTKAWVINEINDVSTNS
jgi:putative DNA primase/helicase